MEIMGGIGLRRAGDDHGMGSAGWDPTEVRIENGREKVFGGDMLLKQHG